MPSENKTTTKPKTKPKPKKIKLPVLPKKLRFPRLKLRSKKTIIILILLFILGSAATIAYLFKDVPNPTKLTKTPAPISTQILDRKGDLLYEIYVDQNRTPISISDLPDYVKNATVAIEDKNFYYHHGLDLPGIARAAFKTLTGQRLEGGSTITQQLIKIALLQDPSRTIARKIREAALALLTEVIYSKDQILELYLNHIPYGGTSYGIQAASQQYFNKSAKDLTIAEAAYLAGLPQAPSRYSPFSSNPQLGIDRQKLVLKNMLEQSYISQDEYDQAVNQELQFSRQASSIKAPHFVFWIRDLLYDQYGADLVNLGGLKVTTTLDLDIQEAAQASLSAEVDSLARLKVGNGAAIVTRPNTGEVLAMVGSRDYFDTEHDGQVNVTLRYRQPGSSIKPLNYATGLILGWSPSTTYLDIPTCFDQTGQEAYCPKNYDNTFHGPVAMRYALANSYNIPAVKQLALNGIEPMIATASAMGITGWDNPDQYGLSLTLGGGEVRMVDMAVAFGSFANSGVKVPLNPILKVETYQGKVLQETNPQDIADLVSTLPQNWSDFWDQPNTGPQDDSSNNTITLSNPLSSLLGQSSPTPIPAPPSQQSLVKTVLPQEVAFIISHFLLDNNARQAAFGSNSQLVIPGKTVSVKTGTTNDLRDNWTIGYTPEYLVATWVGNNDNSPMSYVASGVTGASPIWNDIMRYVLKSQPDHFPTQPPGVVYQEVCSDTGLLPNPDFPCQTRNELFIKDQLPFTSYPTRKQIWVKRDTKVPPLPGEEVIDLDLEEHYVLSDPFTHDFCFDCPYPVETKPDPNNPDQQIPTDKIGYPTQNINYDIFHADPPSPFDWYQRFTSSDQN